MMNAVQDYLRLSSPYCDFLGGLTWSATQDAIEYLDGRTFAFHQEIALFLEGFIRRRPLIHFGFILHLLDLFRERRPAPGPEVVRLRDAFTRTGAPMRNAGVFAAVLCSDVPGVPEEIDVREICARLCDPARPICWYVAMFRDTLNAAQLAPIGPAEFEARVREKLQVYSSEELEAWLRHGRGPVKEAGERLGRHLPLPRTLGGVLAGLLDRPRLAGARPFVAQMVSALTLPPRRLDLHDLPMGGYADVTTRGHVDQLLLSQFALDEWDFFRRFAEKELLYFRREEPHVRTRRELIVLFDQGVRTWGDVRLVLSAAVLALGKQAGERRLAFRIATTGMQGEPVDPLSIEEESLGELVEGSDLSRHPGLALEKILEQTAEESRDIVLLTHPRNLAEPDVRVAARRLTVAARLFALGLDGAGQAQLVEMKHGEPVPVREFHVDFSQAEPAPRALKSPADGPTRWHGDIEPIPSPFCFGLDSLRCASFDFDYGGRWLLTATALGMLYAWRIEGTGHEILPRPMVDGELMTRYQSVVGVSGGFVVPGHVAGWLVAAHYDFVHRRCTVRRLGPATTQSFSWTYTMRYHTLLAYCQAEEAGYAVDLTSGHSVRLQPRDVRPVAWESNRAQEAWEAWWQGNLPGRRCPIPEARERENKRLGIYLDSASGEVTVHGMQWQPFTPRVDGQPSLKGGILADAQWAGHTVAALIHHPEPFQNLLHIFRGGAPVFELAACESRDDQFKLSWDGQHLARRAQHNRIEVLEVRDNPRPVSWTCRGGFPQYVELQLSEHGLYLRTGLRHHFSVYWVRGKLLWDHVTGGGRARFANPLIKEWATGEAALKDRLPARLGYDPQRFVKAAKSHVIAAVDRFGQIAILDRHEDLICMFFAFRDLFAAWMPDGTRLGPPHLTGGPPTPDAAVRIGQALWQASRQGRIA